MRFRLRTLLIALALGPVFLAVAYWGAKEWQRRQAEAAAREAAARFAPSIDLILSVELDPEQIALPDENQSPATIPAPP